ncbi:type I-E CRISPR-associated protein Cas7/Cse4/CasC [Streptomyces sp. NBC_00439]|uniref:type I-E CRISPR-associated protein Cas7/Cse4/CasC n=1 Tax=unclassified Streptomyces TaxID=2593676 RepID=UPI002250EBCF|nr:type I-E CRISPR-associated protein Cas7/Cse4/CasC [Streptomyces sp. NBC_00439]MCX5103626.1 type I-E CRISPR-associated protein Cas7/Cse4/CasC [Streptomyces sp. NBC_00439]WSX06225.1 type I-E CRISPR-associated protein Cas7/Cse4/CasC [Streptomyces sp. NBC_00987]
MTLHATDLAARPAGAEGQITDVTRSPGPFVVVHSLTTVAGVNLNRDMNDLPKTLWHGGIERMRVSAQSLVRAARAYMRTDGSHDRISALSTKSLPHAVAQHLEAKHNVDPADAGPAAALIVAATGLGVSPADPGRTKVMAYVSEDSAQQLSRIVISHWDELAVQRERVEDLIAEALQPAERGTSSRRKPSATIPAAGLPESVATAAQAVLEPGTVEEIALFGRMLAGIPGGRVVSAAHVAHGFGIEPLHLITDEFTAGDDYQDGGVFAGAGMLGRQYLVSGTFYRQAALDRHQLRTTLALSGRTQDEVEALAQSAERRWTRAIVRSLPSGKRSRTGSPPRPTLAVVTTTDEALTASPAFEDAIREQPAGPHAATRLATYLHELGLRGGTALWHSPTGDAPPGLPDVLTVKGY